MRWCHGRNPRRSEMICDIVYCGYVAHSEIAHTIHLLKIQNGNCLRWSLWPINCSLLEDEVRAIWEREGNIIDYRHDPSSCRKLRSLMTSLFPMRNSINSMNERDTSLSGCSRIGSQPSISITIFNLQAFRDLTKIGSSVYLLKLLQMARLLTRDGKVMAEV